MSIYEKLQKIQSEIVATKDLYNSFGKYSYRSAESILQALKPLAKEHGAVPTVSDEMMLIGERYYIKATAKLTDIETGESVETTAYAREAQTKKGMDESQITGSASSYARKYALAGLLGLDDNKDADSMDNRESAQVEYITDAQRKQLSKKATEIGKNAQEMGALLKQKFGVNNSKNLTVTQFNQLMNELK